MRTRASVIAATASLLIVGCAGADPDTGAALSQPQATDELGDDEATISSSSDIGEPADPAEATRTIAVEAFDMAFDPETISVDANEVVTFEVTNTGDALHEFILGDSAMQQGHAEEMADMGHDMAHDDPSSLRIEPGDTEELTWRFPDSGELEYACHEPGHYPAGMHGRIAVG